MATKTAKKAKAAKSNDRADNLKATDKIKWVGGSEIEFREGSTRAKSALAIKKMSGKTFKDIAPKLGVPLKRAGRRIHFLERKGLIQVQHAA